MTITSDAFRSRPPSERDEAIARRLAADLAPLLAERPVSSNIRGLARVREAITDRLVALGFTVRMETLGGDPSVLVATRSGRGSRRIGLSGHYDVEDAGEGWTVRPFHPTLRDDRLFGRGTADNLGPLWLRLQALGDLGDCGPHLVLVLQGEEEVGSPSAHAIYPRLDLPPVDLWIEETGYCELDGRQRLLLRRPNEAVSQMVTAVVKIAARHDRSVEMHDRYLNKAFGEHRCPFLKHLVGTTPYLAIGPNDPRSRIHLSDESLPIANLALSWDQFLAVLCAAVEVV